MPFIAYAVFAVLMSAISPAMAAPIADSLAPVSGFAAANVSDLGGRLSATYRPVGEGRKDWTRQINVSMQPIEKNSNNGDKDYLAALLDGFIETARGDCHIFHVMQVQRAAGYGIAALQCDGFDSVASDGRPSSNNLFLYLEITRGADDLHILLYRWRSDHASARSVEASDLIAREVRPAFDQIRDDLAWPR
jgi:hypothetical protein